jgi:hypothetical protein
MYYFSNLGTSVAVPDPKDPNVFGPPGSASGSVSHKYVPAPAKSKNIKKNRNLSFLFLLICDLFCYFLSLKNYVNVPVFRIRIRLSEVRILCFGSVPKGHGFAILLCTISSPKRKPFIEIVLIICSRSWRRWTSPPRSGRLTSPAPWWSTPASSTSTAMPTGPFKQFWYKCS